MSENKVMKEKEDFTFENIAKFLSVMRSSKRAQSADVFEIILRTGLRLNEVLNLKFTDLNFEYESMSVEKFIPITKGRSISKESLKIMMNKECKEIFKNINDKRSDETFVFQSRRNKNRIHTGPNHISRQLVLKAFKDTSRETSIDITPHSLRHAYAVSFIKSNLHDNSESANLSKILGHTSVNMTNFYLKNIEKESNLERSNGQIKMALIDALESTYKTERNSVDEITKNIISLDALSILNRMNILDDSMINSVALKLGLSETDLKITIQTIRKLGGG
jgi:integrase/recombinase XerD